MVVVEVAVAAVTCVKAAAVGEGIQNCVHSYDKYERKSTYLLWGHQPGLHRRGHHRQDNKVLLSCRFSFSAVAQKWRHLLLYLVAVQGGLNKKTSNN